MDGLFKGIQNETGMGCPADPPADDPTGIDIDNEGHIDEACPGCDIGEVRDPQPVRRGAWNCRFTWSSGQGAALSLTVVFTGLPRMTPCKPISRIRRATVQRAMSNPSRFIWRQTLRTP